MRVTNTMMTNRMLLNMQRNMRYMDTLNNQLASTKRISVPSDDPIGAARALKFRTSVSETEQYQRNVGQGLSWMTATDNAFFNIVDIMTTMRELVNNGATGTNIYDDRAAIANNLQQLVYQIGKEMNATYAGRYVFSGYRTNEPPVFETDNTKAYNITQYFQGSDIESTKVVHKLNNATYGNADAAIPNDVHLIKLAYTGTTEPTVTIGGVSYNVTSKTLSDGDAYAPATGDIHFIAETGELVLGETVFNDMQNGSMEVNYDKTGFKEGDLNPLVYFDCQELAFIGRVATFTVPNTVTINNDTLAVQVCVGGTALVQPITRADSLATLQPDQYHYDPATGVITIGSDILDQVGSSVPPGLDIFDGTTYLSHLSTYTEDTNMRVELNKYTMDDQYMQYEFGVNTRIEVNTLAKNVYTDKMYADLRAFLDFVLSIEISDEDKVLNKYRDEVTAANPGWTNEQIEEEAKSRTEEQLANEKKEAETALHDRFNNMLGLIDKHLRGVSVEETDLGSRMKRLQLIETRLAEDLTNYKELLSENEDTDMFTTAIELSVAQAAYNASLQVGASIIQMTLADYIS